MMKAGQEFYKKAIDVQEEAIKGRYSPINCIQTNATLIDRDWVDLFTALKMQPSVSIDGPEYLHNSIRVFANRDPSYDKVIKGYHLLVDNGVETGMLMVISQNNVRNAKEIWSWILKEKIKRCDFLPCIEPELWRKGEWKYGVSTEEILNFSTSLFDLWFDHGDPNIKIRTFRDALKGQIGGHVNLCSWKAGCLQHFSFDAAGNAFPCARYHCYPETILGNIQQQNFVEIIEGEKFRYVYKSIASGQDKCKSCKWYLMCNSGCPFLKYALYGTWEGTYVHCQFRKDFFEHVKTRIYKTK